MVDKLVAFVEETKSQQSFQSKTKIFLDQRYFVVVEHGISFPILGC